jgi:SPP1 gp7 family putative phage head morphogenesis protein
MPTTALTPAERRHRAAIVRAARMGGALAVRIRSALSVCVDALPERPGPHDLLRMRAHVETAVELMRRVLGERFRQMLMSAAEREHFLTAVELTRASRRGRTEEAWTDYLRLVVPAPAFDFLERIVGVAHRALTRLIDPQRASNVVLQGVAAGKNRKQIADDLEDVFGGFERVARRVARDEGIRVATQTQLAVSEQVPDLVAGYEINSVLDDRVRPEHRKRHGHKFYRTPKAGQRPLSDCPQPPLEADGSWAHGCRCFLIPIIEIDGEEV